MADVIKVLGDEITLTNTAANTVSNSTLVRLMNTSNSTILTITQQNSDSANIASFSLDLWVQMLVFAILKKSLQINFWQVPILLLKQYLLATTRIKK